MTRKFGKTCALISTHKNDAAALQISLFRIGIPCMKTHLGHHWNFLNHFYVLKFLKAFIKTSVTKLFFVAHPYLIQLLF